MNRRSLLLAFVAAMAIVAVSATVDADAELIKELTANAPAASPAPAPVQKDSNGPLSWWWYALDPDNPLSFVP